MKIKPTKVKVVAIRHENEIQQSKSGLLKGMKMRFNKEKVVCKRHENEIQQRKSGL